MTFKNIKCFQLLTGTFNVQEMEKKGKETALLIPFVLMLTLSVNLQFSKAAVSYKL